jgi:hypothetical protein
MPVNFHFEKFKRLHIIEFDGVTVNSANKQTYKETNEQMSLFFSTFCRDLGYVFVTKSEHGMLSYIP